MSSGGPAPRAHGGACEGCLRRSWLLSALSGPLDCCARNRGRLLDVLALGDRELLEALAGRRASELEARYERFSAAEAPSREQGVHAICRHRQGFPSGVNGPAAPHLLSVSEEVGRLVELTTAPVVAILGSRAPSDYGVEMARSLARGLAVSGVTVAAGLTDGIAVAAHAGALDAGAGSVAVLGGGLRVSCPPRRRSLYERIKLRGCAISELPLDCAGRRWGQLASERIVVELGALAVVVEADRTPEDLAAARIARMLARTVAAVPGRVTSPLSRGTHALLLDGARLVRGPRDVLELLFMVGATSPLELARTRAKGAIDPHAELTPRQRATLARVAAGCDTPDKLARTGVEGSELLLALSELELMGLLARGDGGRYLPRIPLD